jgi:hypothetical protein
MRAQTWFDGRPLATWGASRGAEPAHLHGATFPEINAVAARMPSGVMFRALGPAEPGDTRPRAARTFRGLALPYLQERRPAISHGRDRLPRMKLPPAAPVIRVGGGNARQISSAQRARS